ncbi:hypothetical protein D3C71_1714310 [compost metagenome]
MPVTITASTAPSAPIGTMSITVSGIAQLSYNATSIRNTTRMARANRLPAWPLETFSWYDRPVQA